MENANFIIMEDKVSVYATTDIASLVIAELNNDDEIICDEKVKKNQILWVTVFLPDGKKGFIRGDVKGCSVRLVTLNQSSADVFEDSEPSSKIILTYHKGEKFQIIGAEKRDDVLWVRTESPTGVIGFIDENVKIKEVIQFTPSEKWPIRGSYIGATAGVLIVLYISIFSDRSQFMSGGEAKGWMVIAGIGGLILGYGFTYFFIKIKRSISQQE